MNLLLALVLLSESTAPNQVLLDAGRSIGAKSILTGTANPTLQQLAQAQANYCAAKCVQGHQLWDGQFQMYYRQFPGLRSITAESFPWQTDIREGASSCTESWKHSKPHWMHFNNSCRYYGFAITQGRNGVWYACAIFSD